MQWRRLLQYVSLCRHAESGDLRSLPCSTAAGNVFTSAWLSALVDTGFADISTLQILLFVSAEVWFALHSMLIQAEAATQSSTAGTTPGPSVLSYALASATVTPELTPPYWCVTHVAYPSNKG